MSFFENCFTDTQHPDAPCQCNSRFVGNNRELHIANTLLRIALLEKLAIKSAYDSDMYNRAFPVGNALFLFAGGMMSLLRLPRQARVCGATKAPLGLSLLRFANANF